MRKPYRCGSIHLKYLWFGKEIKVSDCRLGWADIECAACGRRAGAVRERGAWQPESVKLETHAREHLGRRRRRVFSHRAQDKNKITRLGCKICGQRKGWKIPTCLTTVSVHLENILLSTQPINGADYCEFHSSAVMARIHRERELHAQTSDRTQQMQISPLRRLLRRPSFSCATQIGNNPRKSTWLLTLTWYTHTF